jgi:hypothetical protein
VTLTHSTARESVPGGGPTIDTIGDEPGPSIARNELFGTDAGTTSSIPAVVSVATR